MDIEGTMKFILDQHARFASEIDRVNAVLKHTSEVLANVAERQNKSEQTILKLGQSMMRSDERYAKTQQTILEAGRTILEVANAQQRTNEILANLLTVERHLSDHNQR